VLPVSKRGYIVLPAHIRKAMYKKPGAYGL